MQDCYIMIKMKDASVQIGVDNVALYNYAERKDTSLTLKTIGSHWAFEKEEWETFKQSDACKRFVEEYKLKQKKEAKKEKRKQKKIEAQNIDVKKELEQPIETIELNQKNIDTEEFDDSVFLNIKEDPKEKIIESKSIIDISSDAEEEWLSNVIQEKLYDKDGNVLYDFTKYPEPSAPKGDEP